HSEWDASAHSFSLAGAELTGAGAGHTDPDRIGSGVPGASGAQGGLSFQLSFVSSQIKTAGPVMQGYKQLCITGPAVFGRLFSGRVLVFRCRRRSGNWEFQS